VVVGELKYSNFERKEKQYSNLFLSWLLILKKEILEKIK